MAQVQDRNGASLPLRGLAAAAVLLGTVAGCGEGEPPRAPEPESEPPRGGNAAPPGSGEPDAPPLAWIDGDPVYADVVGPAPGSTKEARRRALERALDRRLAAREARRRGLDDEPWVREAVEAVRARARRAEEEVLVDALAAELAGEELSGDDALRAEFEAHPERFAQPRFTLRLSRYATREAAEAAAETLERTGFLAETAFEDLGPAFVWELPDWLRPHVHELDAEGDRLILPVSEGFVLVETAHVEVLPPPSFEGVREQVMRMQRRSAASLGLEGLREELRAEHDIRIREGALEDHRIWNRP